MKKVRYSESSEYFTHMKNIYNFPIGSGAARTSAIFHSKKPSQIPSQIPSLSTQIMPARLKTPITHTITSAHVASKSMNKGTKLFFKIKQVHYNKFSPHFSANPKWPLPIKQEPRSISSKNDFASFQLKASVTTDRTLRDGN